MKIYKFSTPTCGQCKVVTSLLKKNGVTFEEIDCTLDENESIVKSYGIQSVPTVIVVVDDNGYMKRLNNIAEVKDWLAYIK